MKGLRTNRAGTGQGQGERQTANGKRQTADGRRRNSRRRNCVTGIRYNVAMDIVGIRNRVSSRSCAWCTTEFAAEFRPGRPRIYCRTSCRQRAYERRRGLAVLPPPDRLIMSDNGPLSHLPNRYPGYERGEIRTLYGRKHAMRPSGIAELGERRLTLCGLLARPVARNFHRTSPESCLTCKRVENVRPSARAVRPSADLAALRALLDRAAVETSRTQQQRTKSSEQVLFELLAAA